MASSTLAASEMTQRLETVTRAINGDRLWETIMDLARFGATANGGLNRQALTNIDNAAHSRLLEWFIHPHYSFSVDAIGNLFIRRGGAKPDAAPVMTGSHLDTQPSGGKFDGIYGVLAGLEVFRTLDDLGVTTTRPLELAVWANEEGCRFIPGCMGSACFARPVDLPDWLARRDNDDITVHQAVAGFHQALSGIPHRPLGIPVHAYIEAHIEQGPILEENNTTIGIVSGIQGCRDFQITVTGIEAHAGTTPEASRHDAMQSAVHLLNDMYAVMASAGEDCRFTVGTCYVYPNSNSVVPGKVVFNIDFRHPEQSVLQIWGDKIIALCEKWTGRCTIAARELRWRKPVIFPKTVPDLIEQAAARLKLTNKVLPSGASHDAVNLHECCPTGMIFIPCEGGISHNEREYAAPGDLHAGTQVLAEVLCRLAETF